MPRARFALQARQADARLAPWLFERAHVLSPGHASTRECHGQLAKPCTINRAMKRIALLLILLLGGCSADEESSGRGGSSGSDAAVGGSSGSTASGGSGGTSGGGGSGGVAGFGGTAGSAGAPAKTRTLVYVGSGSKIPDNIRIFELEKNQAKLKSLGTATSGGTASFMAKHPKLPMLYVADTSTQSARVFEMDPQLGKLSPKGSVSLSGAPVHFSVDASGKYLLAAHYGAGKVDVIALKSDGSLDKVVDTKTSGAKAHAIVPDRQNKFVFVPNNGANTISQYRFNATTGALSNNTPKDVVTTDGPRHMDFHPKADFAYVMNEQGTSMSAYKFDATKGTLNHLETEESLPSGLTGGTGADVHVHPSGKFVYGSNRNGPDSTIVIFSIAGDGKLDLVGHEKTKGDRPRNFELVSDGKVLLVANQNSSNVAVFTIDPVSGKLSHSETVTVTKNPTFVGAYDFALP